MGYRTWTTYLGLSLTSALICGCAGPRLRPASATPVASRSVASEVPSPFSFAILSDIHVYPDGHLTPQFHQVVTALLELRPRLIIIAGDSTNGNLNDHYDREHARRWWARLKEALHPLEQAGIPIHAIAGNHDFYRKPHQEAYAEAWNTPLFYSLEIEGVHFSLLHVIDQKLEPSVREWLKTDLESAGRARLRFAFGHVPLASAMGHTNAAFRNELGQLLARGGVSAYFAGHEHLVWDEALSLGTQSLRQVIVGTASGSYTFPVSGRTYRAHCRVSICLTPNTQLRIAVDPLTRLEKHTVSFTVVEVQSGDAYVVRPLTLDKDGKVLPFYEPPPATAP